MSGNPVIDAGGQFRGYRGTGRDVTAEVEARAELLAAKEQAELADRTKTEFLANMSHELRTPLNAIIGFSELTRDQKFGPLGSERYLQYMDDISISGQHLLGVINDILDISKIEAGAQILDEREVDVGRAVQACLTLIGERARDAGLALEAEIAPGLPLYRADERKLKQVVLNLLSNAVKFSPAGGTVRVKVSTGEGGGLVLEVIDQGIGIAPEDIPKAMAPFRQVDGDLNRRYEGTGLGLPLAKALVELHDGRFSLESAPGVGTTAIVALPAARMLRPADSVA